MVMVCEHHNIEMPILGVKEAMSAMSNSSLLSTFWLEKPSLTHEYGKVIYSRRQYKVSVMYRLPTVPYF